MDFLKSLWPTPFKIKEKDVKSLLIQLIIFLLVCVVVNIVDDPMRDGSPIKTPFDGEGVATARRAVVENGVLKTMLYDLTTAKKAGVVSTGNGQKGSYAAPVSIAPYNFGLMAGDCDLDTLLSKAGEGIYITECKGFHAGANAITGDFSIESAGFMIRDGKLAVRVTLLWVLVKWDETPNSRRSFPSEVRRLTV